MGIQIQPGAFNGTRPAMVIDLQTEKRTVVENCKRWAGDPSCWDTTDEQGKRRVFKSNGTLFVGNSSIVVNYCVV